MEKEVRLNQIDDRLGKLRRTMDINSKAIEQAGRNGGQWPQNLLDANRSLADEIRDLSIEKRKLQGVKLAIK